MKYNKIFINILIILLSFALVKADDEEESTTEAVEVILTPGPITGEYKKKDLNDSYDEDSSIVIECSGNTCNGNGEGLTIEEGIVTISSAGTYVVKGELEGQLNISATKDDFIHLILDNMTIVSNDGPALYVTKCDKLVITTVGENSLTDSTNYTVDEDEEPDACLFAKCDLTFNGEGILTVNGNYKEGIRCKKDLKFVSGTINVVSVEKGIKAKNSISIKEAVINVDAVDSGIKVTKDDDPEKGFIVIDGGKITVKSGNDGIHAESHLTINDGYINVSESKEGLEGQMIDILGGEIYVNANDDGINASKIGAVNDEFGPGGQGGPGGMGPGGFNDTMFGPGGFNETMFGPGNPVNMEEFNITMFNPEDIPQKQTNDTFIPLPQNEDVNENENEDVNENENEDVNENENENEDVNEDENENENEDDEDKNTAVNEAIKTTTSTRRRCLVKHRKTRTVYITSIIKKNKPTSIIEQSDDDEELETLEKRGNTENDEQ
eukprot:jgi/Orpsp1_1/1178893/evm.model.c7180000067125.1